MRSSASVWSVRCAKRWRDEKIEKRNADVGRGVVVSVRHPEGMTSACLSIAEPILYMCKRPLTLSFKFVLRIAVCLLLNLPEEENMGEQKAYVSVFLVRSQGLHHFVVKATVSLTSKQEQVILVEIFTLSRQNNEYCPFFWHLYCVLPSFF